MHNDIAEELSRLHNLEGADFIAKLKEIAGRSEFHPIEEEKNIYIVGGERSEDYNNLLNAARKAVELGYRVFILPNPKGVRTADFIFEQKGIYKMYDLKTIQGKASVGNRLKESVGQANHVLLNIRCSYDTRTLAVDIRTYFEKVSNAVEVLVFKGRKVISVKRKMTDNPRYFQIFRRMYEK